MKQTKIIHKVLNTQGMTLVEILAAITILSIILVTIIGFFTQAAAYTARNERKTVAISVAQGAMNYIQQENFDKLKEETTTSNTPILKIDTTDEIKALLDEPTIAENILKDTMINNVSFKDKLHIYVVDYDGFNTEQVEDQYNKELPTILKDTLLEKTTASTTQTYLLHTYVLVEWDEKAPAVLLEGTIKHESLR